MKQHFEEMEEEEEGPNESLPSSFAFPFSFTSTSSKIDLLALLPPRAIVDRLVSRFFNSNSPSLCEFLVSPACHLND
jgi:hypothetical protein